MLGKDDIVSAGMQIIDKVIPNPADKEAAKLELLKLQQSGELEKMQLQNAKHIANIQADTQLLIAQTELNKVEAASDDKFARRWRPFCGWVCTVGLAYHFILQPFMAFFASVFNHPIVLPAFEMDSLYTILMGILGLGGMRSFERVKVRRR
ncbi:MAG: hypothetical protein K0R98_702 [Rickettsiaceae bacterium]|jgi:hypothetical protein|nr:hypothetical protein [Rickettsiaceae bacterium]